jgi:hypothetical protein
MSNPWLEHPDAALLGVIKIAALRAFGRSSKARQRRVLRESGVDETMVKRCVELTARIRAQAGLGRVAASDDLRVGRGPTRAADGSDGAGAPPTTPHP